MSCFHARKTHALVIAAAATICLAASENLVAASPDAAPNVTYTASGVFATPQISGADLYKLQGEPFSISITTNAATEPTSHGAQWAQYTKQHMTGTVTSGLDNMPISIPSNFASFELAAGNPSYDVFELFAPITAFGLQINILANIQMPPGTIVKPLVHPFATVSLAPPDIGPTYTVTYSDTTNSTKLGIQSGTLTATIPGGGPNTEVQDIAPQLHAGAAEVVTMHADGTRSVQRVSAAPVDLSAASDSVALQFYASGLRDGSDVHMQIAGHYVPVQYAGPAAHYPGLDQVIVKVPHSLAGSGDADVALIVAGRAAKPVHIQIQ
jgi:uncharacterized protein (TIGR03437 family)